MTKLTPWKGGSCPVAAGTVVTAKLRNNYTYTRPASAFRWTHEDGAGAFADVVAYRVEPA